MKIKCVESTSSWQFKVPILIVGVYFLVILPCTQILFRSHPWIYNHTDTLFFAAVVIFIFIRFNLIEIGFSTKYLKQNLILGLISGWIILLSLPVLNAGLEVADLTSHKLVGRNSISDFSFNFKFLLEKIGIILFIPLIEQIFFTGFVLQCLLKKINPILAVYSLGLIYSLTGFNLTFGSFLLGIGASSLFILTGTLYAPILFHMSCAMGWELISNLYPRLIIVFGFLF